MTGQELEKYLQEKLIGQAFSYWTLESDILRYIRAYFKDTLNWTDEQTGCIWVSHAGNSNRYEVMLIIRKNGRTERACLAYVDVKKQKGQRHYSWGSAYYDWTIKNINARFYGEEDTFESRAEAIKKETKEKFEAVDALETQAKELGAYLMEKYGGEHKAREVLEMLYKNKYSFIKD